MRNAEFGMRNGEMRSRENARPPFDKCCGLDAAVLGQDERDRRVYAFDKTER
jgi:hypothetical protein